MAESVTYGSYSFPSPAPFVGQGVEPVYVEGKVDYFIDAIQIVGNITGENLSGLHLQKMKMISGLLPEFQTLTVTNDASNKEFLYSTPQSISFSESDLTTVLPYSIELLSFSSGDPDSMLSSVFGVADPVDSWTFTETDGRITDANHTVSARGLKTNSKDPLQNALDFVSGRSSGYLDISLFQTGDHAFLVSRTESIDKAKNSYSIESAYKYSTSENPVTKSGIFSSNTQIAFDKDNGLTLNVNASLQGSITGALINTGHFTADQATEIAVNTVANSLSDYESGVYTFVRSGPRTASFQVDTGSNTVNFSYAFSDPSNLDQEGNILHKKTASVRATKDRSDIEISVRGDIIFNSPSKIIGTGDPATGERFKELDAFYSGVIDDSGFLNLAVEALKDFRLDATGYHISGDYVNPVPTTRSITKNAEQSEINYDLTFTNKIDLSSGTLSGLQVSISDKKPLTVSGIVPSIAGFTQQILNNRTAGEYAVSASCEASTGTLAKLQEIVSGQMTGFYEFSKTSSVNEDTISFNLSKYY